MKSIGVIGANGQVGSEVCLYLSMFEGVEVVPICRGKIASALLRRMGLQCRHGSVAKPEEARELLKGLDLIVDFSLPAGAISQIVRDYRRNISGVMQAAPPGASYVFISSLMALGVAGVAAELKYRVLSKTSYGYTKRIGERLARRLGRATGRPTWVLRLGQVYGPLQSTSRNLTESITAERVIVPDAPSYSVFGYTIAEALVQIASGREQPGLYSLVSSPAFSWEELYLHYAHQRGIRPEIGRLPVSSPASAARLAAPLRNWLSGRAGSILTRNREVLSAYVLSRFPRLEKKLKAALAIRRARTEIGGLRGGRMAFEAFRGRVIPGPFLTSLSDPRVSMPPFEGRLREQLEAMWRNLNVAPMLAQNERR